MTSRATVLLLDDGDLSHVGVLLFEMGMDLTWKTGAEIRGPMSRPGDILVTNRKRALEIPHLIPNIGDPGGPAWICFHHKDFPSLREFLRELGAHFLVHTGGEGTDPELLRLLFRQLAHHGTERRQRLRLPCSCRVQCSAGGEHFEADLRDLAGDSCRIELPRDLRVTSAISVYFPAELDPSAPTAYPGVVLRTQLLDRDTHRFATVVGFDDEGVKRKIATILAGQGIGTRIIQISSPPERTGPGDAIPLDRRELQRRRYGRRVACLRSLEDDHPHVLKAHDLSMTGIRVDRHPDLQADAEVILALPQGKGVSPLLIEGTVCRDTGVEGVGIEFTGLDADKREALRGMLSKLTPIDPRTLELDSEDLVLLGDFDDPRGGRPR